MTKVLPENRKGIYNMKKIDISDITLKVLSEDRGVSLLFREKTAVASCADSLGADGVELAPIKSLREDKIIYKTISQNVKGIVSIPTGFTKEDTENAWECVKEAKSPRLQVELPVSTTLMEYTYHLKAEKMIEKIKELVNEAKKYSDDVEFIALDATRADEDFLVNCVSEAEISGANVITICDNSGRALPCEIENLVKKIKDKINVKLYVQVSDKLGMAASAAISAVKAGADGLKCSMISGDALSMGRISDVFVAREETVKAETNLKSTRIHAGIDDLLLNIKHETYETENEVSEKKKILLDTESSISQVSQAAEMLGYDLSAEDCNNVLKAVVHVAEKKGTVGAKEFEALIASSAMQAPSTYHLESYSTNCGNLTSSMSQVTLKSNGEILSGVSTGDGPIDSAFRAIEQCVGHHYELDDFQVQAVTEGKEALGTALVKLRSRGKLYSGNGISTDIVAASIRAYINALNKIVFEER